MYPPKAYLDVNILFGQIINPLDQFTIYWNLNSISEGHFYFYLNFNGK